VLTSLSGKAMDDMESDLEALSFWFSRARANKYIAEARTVLTSGDDLDGIGLEIRMIKVTPLIASHLRRRGWSFTAERDFENA